MIKMLLCLASGMVLAIAVLQLRQQHLEFQHETTELHDRIKGQQARLWNQQLQIAVYTAPNAIAQTVSNQHLKMVPENAPKGVANWTDQKAQQNADAE